MSGLLAGGTRAPGPAVTQPLKVRVRLLPEPCLWCWEIVDAVSGDLIECSWDTEWCDYPTGEEEAAAAGRGRASAILQRSAE